MKKITLVYDSYPTGIEEAVRKELGIEFKKDSIECGLWEEKDCDVIHDDISSSSFCKEHSIVVAEVTIIWKNWQSQDKTQRTEIFYKTPRVLVAMNEGGNNSTGVCLDCIKEYLEE